jgi:hypothetical protein
VSAVTPPPSTKAKGDLLESVIERLCAGFLEKKVSRNARLPGRNSLADRDIDVLIEGRFAMFDMRIAIESKNYKDPVGVEKVEAFCTKLEDVNVHTGVMVSAAGFTEAARNTAAAQNIQLFQVYDQSVSDQTLWVPVGLVKPLVTTFSVGITHRSGGGFSMPAVMGQAGLTVDFSRLVFLVGDRRLDLQEIVGFAWLDEKIPAAAGQHKVNIGPVAFEDIDQPAAGLQYCELGIEVTVVERHYLKVFPACYMKDVHTGKENHDLHVDLYSSDERLSANGWQQFPSLEEMQAAQAAVPNQIETFSRLVVCSADWQKAHREQNLKPMASGPTVRSRSGTRSSG